MHHLRNTLLSCLFSITLTACIGGGGGGGTTPADNTAPTVLAVSPADTTTNAGAATTITVTFSEPVDPSTVNASTFIVGVSGTITYSGNTATFTPSSPLPPNTIVTPVISTGVRDLAGNAITAPYFWSFVTATYDATPPTILSASPAPYASAVVTSSTVSATFSEAMDPATVTGTEFTLMNGTTPVLGTVTYTGMTATFTPAAALAPSTTYIAKITTGVKDMAGNAMNWDYSWSFTTAAPDITPPTVSSTSPADLAPSVIANSTVSVTFSEAMDPATVTGARFTVMNGTTPVTGTVTYSGTTATFTPAAALAPSTTYIAKITTGVKDLAGNAMALPYTWSFTSEKQINVLGFTVVDAEYSKALDKIVMVSSVPTNQLHIYNPVTNVDTAVALNLPPSTVSVSPDGLFAAVGHNAWISYVDLSTGTLLKTLPVAADVLDIVLAGNGYAYVFPRIDQWVNIHAVNIATGVETLSTGFSIYAGTKGKLNAAGTAMYGVTNYLSPDNIEKYNLGTGTPSYAYGSPYWGDYPVCGDLWMSEDGLRIFTKCGNVFNSTSLQATDMVYGGALPSLPSIRHLSHSSAAGSVIAIPDNSWGTTNLDTEIRVYGYQFLTFVQSIPLPHFVVGNNAYAGHGRFVFYNSTGAKSFVVLQADTGSGMLYDYGVVTY